MVKFFVPIKENEEFKETQFPRLQNFDLNIIKPELAENYVEVPPTTGLVAIMTISGEAFTYCIPFNHKDPAGFITEKFGLEFGTDFIFIWAKPEPTAESNCLYLGSEWN